MKTNTTFKLIPVFILLFAGYTITGCRNSGEKNDSYRSAEELFSHYQNGDYFRLREGIPNSSNIDDPEMLFLSAVSRHAFNEPGASNQVIRQLMPQPSSLADSLVAKLYPLKLENHMRLHQYGEARDVAQKMKNNTDKILDSSAVANAQNISPLLEALAGVPPQKVTVRKATTLEITRDKAGLQRIPVSIGDMKRYFVLDTGANYSVLMRSEAEELGLTVRPSGILVTAATGSKVEADVAVADKIALGNMVYQNVLFLVFPDRALSFPQIDFHIPGIIGFPLIEAAGEIRFLKDDQLKIPAEIPLRDLQNMALKGLSPRVQVEIQVPLFPDSLKSESFICTLDTGAPKTSLLAPFYRRFTIEVMRYGKPDTVQVGSAGGSKNMPVYQIPEIELQLGNAKASLKEISVHTETTFEEVQSALACNIGQDVLGQFEETIMNYKSMSLLLR